MPLIRKDPAGPGNPPRPDDSILPNETGSPDNALRANDLSDPGGEPRAGVRPDAEIPSTGTTAERWRAARALGAGPDGTKALGEALKMETDPRVREAIFTSLIRIGNRESVAIVVPCLSADDANIRMGALDALRAMIGVVRPLLPALLADPDADVRVLTCDLARELPSPEATRLLCDVLAREPEPNVCAAAVDVLADIGEADALPFLQSCAARFNGMTFLTFAVEIAMERIVAERPSGHA
jgi:HEAT repeat protein